MIADSIGTVVVGYHVDVNNCTGGTTQSITVDVTAVPTITSSDLSMCSGEERILSAIPSGGDFSVLSGPGVITGDTLTSTGAGEIHIQYGLPSNACFGIVTQIINSQQSPVANFINPPEHLCLNDSIALQAVPTGGTFQLLSGPATLNSNMLKSVGVGNILIAYTITQNGCTSADQKLVNSAEIPEPTFTMDTLAMCSGSSRALSGSPEGGIFWVIGGPGKVGNGILTSTGKGKIKLSYLVNNAGCVGDTFQVILSKPTPAVSFESDSLLMCIGKKI